MGVSKYVTKGRTWWRVDEWPYVWHRQREVPQVQHAGGGNPRQHLPGATHSRTARARGGPAAAWCSAHAMSSIGSVAADNLTAVSVLA